MSHATKLPADFDPCAYLDLNSDVRAEGADPIQHWLKFGRFENRPYSWTVDTERTITIPKTWAGEDSFGKGIEIINFCLAHTDAYFPLDDNLVICEMAKKGAIKATGLVLNCEEMLPEYGTHKPFLGLVYGLFAAHAYLKQLSFDRNLAVNFMTYRLFTLPFTTPLMDKRLNMNMLRADEVHSIQRFIVPTKAASPWLMPHPFLVDSIEAQYRASHIAADLDGFLECAVAEGVLTREDVSDCRSNIMFLPTAGTGRMPARVFCEITDMMVALTRSYLRRADFSGRDSYQIRFVQFCYERVMSFLVEREMREQSGLLDKRHFGFWTLVSENDRYEPGLVNLPD